MKTLFIDCDAHLTGSWASVYRQGDPAIDVNTKPFARDAVPEMAAGYQIVIDDHSYFPAPILERCTALEHIVYLGTGASSYVDTAAPERPATRALPSTTHCEPPLARHPDYRIFGGGAGRR